MARAHASSGHGSLAPLLAALLVAAGCTADFDRKHAEAERSRALAAAAGYEWIETSKLLQQAETAADAGDMEVAFQLLEKAQFQAEAAIRQSEHEAGAWRDRVIR